MTAFISLKNFNELLKLNKMTSHQIYNQNANNKRQNISKSPINSFNRYQYGEKLEKDNYSLYVSGSGYEKKENNRPQEEKQVKKVMKKYHNFNQDNKNDILSSSDNYGFKEIKNLKGENNNNERQQHSIDSTNNRKRIITINKGDNVFIKGTKSPKRRIITKYINTKMNKNAQIKPLHQNKSFDCLIPKNRIQKIYQETIRPSRAIYDNDYYPDNNGEIVTEEIRREGDYFIKITTKRKELDPNIIQPINKQNFIHDKFGVYQKKYIPKKRNNIQNIPTYYYIENNENNNDQMKYRERGNYNRYKYMDKYEQNINDERKEDYYEDNYNNMNSREFNRYERSINGNEDKFFNLDDIKGIKNIECPLHGRISFVIHDNPLGYK